MQKVDNAIQWIKFYPVDNAIYVSLIQGCALAEPCDPWHITFAQGQLENIRFFIQILCWAP